MGTTLGLTLEGKRNRSRRKSGRYEGNLRALAFPSNPDFNIHVQAGCSIDQVTQRNGRQLSAAGGYLRDARHRASLRVETGRSLRDAEAARHPVPFHGWAGLAEQTPLMALWFGEPVAGAGTPNGVVNIVTGCGKAAGAPLAGLARGWTHPPRRADAHAIAARAGTPLREPRSRRIR
jgi:hypothetical protein